jgi:hypothetical protein
MGLGHAMCTYCGNVVETSLHAIRDCALVTPLWLQIVPLEDRCSFFMDDLQTMDSFQFNKGNDEAKGW